jgi:predicted PhzF superfamily epimerase YddE/YHI9
MPIPIFQVDAFSGEVFKGNPAAVCPLDDWLDDTHLQAIAAENNLAETAYFVAKDGAYELRWFTPTQEMDLCGHATLASAFVIFQFLDPRAAEIKFLSKSGPLVVRRDGDLLALDFPSRPPQRCEPPPGLESALGKRPLETWRARDTMAVFGSEEEVRSLKPRMERLLEMDAHAFIATAPGRQADFVSRFFAPAVGVPEDPVTGSAHCTLIPYWADRLGKKHLRALQVSFRGGELICEHRGDRVTIAGRAALYLEGTIRV